jgi:hypothetical protein
MVVAPPVPVLSRIRRSGSVLMALDQLGVEHAAALLHCAGFLVIRTGGFTPAGDPA